MHGIESSESDHLDLAALRDAVEANPKDWEAHFALADWLHKHREPWEALLHYGQCLALHPVQASIVLLAIGQAHWMTATDLVESGEDADWDRPEFTRRAENALRCLDLALVGNPNLYRVHADRGEVLLGLQRWDDAVSEYRWLLEEDPDNPRYLSILAMCLLRSGRFASAKRNAERALEVDPDRGSLAASVLADISDHTENTLEN